MAALVTPPKVVAEVGTPNARVGVVQLVLGVPAFDAVDVIIFNLELLDFFIFDPLHYIFDNLVSYSLRHLVSLLNPVKLLQFLVLLSLFLLPLLSELGKHLLSLRR